MDQGEWFLAPENIRRVIAAVAPEAFRETMLKAYDLLREILMERLSKQGAIAQRFRKEQP